MSGAGKEMGKEEKGAENKEKERKPRRRNRNLSRKSPPSAESSPFDARKRLKYEIKNRLPPAFFICYFPQHFL
jgi:hypothetical protein